MAHKLMSHRRRNVILSEAKNPGERCGKVGDPSTQPSKFLGPKPKNLDGLAQDDHIKNMVNFKTIIILGRPGAGKGTQAALLAEKTGFRHLSTGDILRKRAKRQDNLGAKIKKLIDEGKFVSDEIILNVIFEAIKKAFQEGKKGVILDGLPRNLSQAESLSSFLKAENFENPLAINVNISNQEAIFRLTNRKTCSRCGKTIPYSEKTADLKKCPECKGKLITRPDDREEVVRERLKIYEEETALVIDFYKEKGLLKEVEGERPIEEIHRDILSLVS